MTASRPDCHFILLTHDLDLVTDFAKQPSQTFVLSSSRWSGEEVTGWHLTRHPGSDNLTQEARTAILGGRRKLVFVEGLAGSADAALYHVLYPDRQFVSAAGSAEVLRSVAGLRAAQDHHWVEAQGIIDGDHRSTAEIANLRSRHIAVLPVAEVENLYYLDEVMKSVAQAYLPQFGLDLDADECIAKARQEALDVLSAQAERLTGRLALAAVRRHLSENLPTKLDPDLAEYVVKTPSPYCDILSKVRGFIDGLHLQELVRLLPVRDSSFRNTIARELYFTNTLAYEAYARELIRCTPALAEQLRNLVNLPG